MKILTFIGLFLFPWIVDAQCGYSGIRFIPDASVTQYFIQVDGASFNDLSVGGQGVCRVNLTFKHPHIGDLGIKLKSPSGQTISLIGAVGNSSNTSGSTWDVHFVRQSALPQPDIGILPQWSNASNWTTNNSYTGTYHPMAGNQLEQLNSGPVDGLWVIEITDGSQLDIGELSAFSIEFCKPQGISCSSCIPDAGRISISEIKGCEGSQSLKPSFNIQYLNGGNGAGFLYKFIISKQDDKIIAILDSLDFRTFPAGTYQACGIVLNSGSVPLLPKTDTSEIMSDWRNRYYDGLPAFCGDISLECVVVKIRPISVNQEKTLYICKNNPIYIEGDTISSPGKYSYRYTNRFGCDSIMKYQVLPVQFNQTLVVTNKLTCSSKEAIVRLEGSYPPQTTMVWFNQWGILRSGVDLDSLKVTSPGLIYLALERSGCRDTLSVDVQVDITLPSVAITSGFLNCDRPSIVINTTVSPSNVTFDWTGPGGYTSNSADPTVTIPGIYRVVVTMDDGCSISQDVLVAGDFNIPDFNFQVNKKECSADTVTIRFSTPDQLRTMEWLLPDGSKEYSNKITTNQNGWFYLTVTGDNGCVKMDSVFVDFKTQNPDIQVMDAHINCLQPTIQLPATAQQQNFTITWSGPGGFTSNILSPTIDTAGIYTAIATSGDNCISRVQIRVTEDFIVPKLTISPNQFKCKTDSLRINTTSIPSNVVFIWEGPNNYSSLYSDPYIFETGWYYATITSPNGCFKADSVFIDQSVFNPDITVEDGEITCQIDSALLIVNTINPSNPVIQWNGPNNYFSGQKAPWVKNAGQYWVKVTNKANGCFTKKSVLIADNTAVPKVALFQDSINCSRVDATIGFINNSTLKEYFWITPGQDTVFQKTKLTTAVEDTFRLHIKNIYGCVLDTIILVSSDHSVPKITIPDFVLSCDKPTVQLSASSTLGVLSYKWTFPDGSFTTDAKPSASMPGNYSIKIIATNGCSDSLDFVIKADTLEAGVDIQPLFLSCQKVSDTLRFTTTMPGGDIIWHGPQQYVSTSVNPIVTLNGTYYLTYTSPNGCRSVDSILVVMTDSLPTLKLKDDTLDCLKNLAILKPVTDATVPVYLWKDPQGNTFSSDTLLATMGGLYVVEITDRNKCVVRDTALIIVDTLKPISILSNEYFINCTNDSLEVKAVKNVKNYSFKWYDEQGVISIDTSLFLYNLGDYMVDIGGDNGCVSRHSFRVNGDLTKPDLTAIGGELNCDYTKIVLQSSSQTDAVSLSWIIDTLTIVNSSVTVDKAGLYKAIARGLNGCVSDTIVRIDSNYKKPELVVSDGSLSCDSSNYLLHVITTSNIGSYGWFGSNGFFSDQPNVYVVDTGYYFIFLKGANGCLSIDTVYVDDNPPEPNISLKADVITCYSTQVPLLLSSDGIVESQLWTGPDGFVSDELKPSVSVSGTYMVNMTNDYGCFAIDSIFVPIDTVKPIVLIESGDSIFCNHREIILTGKTGNNVTAAYEWSTIDGHLIGQIDDKSVQIRDTGTYTLLIQDLNNGCIQTKDTVIQEVQNPIDSLIVTVMPVSCEGINDGEIVIHGAEGAKGALQYSILQDHFGPYNYYNRLSPGDYFVQVKDTFGCVFGDSINLGLAEPIGLNLGNDTTIRLGQPIFIDTQLNIDSAQIDHILWDSAPVSCNGCIAFTDRPKYSIIYSIKVKAKNGCEAKDSKLVVVESNDLVFVPNIFSPNGDGRNDILEISVSPAVDEIEQLVIADRWGNIVYSREKYKPEENAGGWDGKMNGASVGPGVFVYLVRYRLITGEQLKSKGDITLIR